MADWDDVRRCALGLPEVTEGTGERHEWRVKGKLFVWERPLRKGEVAALGDAAPTGPVLEVVTVDAFLARAPKRLAKEYLASG